MTGWRVTRPAGHRVKCLAGHCVACLAGHRVACLAGHRVERPAGAAAWNGTRPCAQCAMRGRLGRGPRARPGIDNHAG